MSDEPADCVIIADCGVCNDVIRGRTSALAALLRGAATVEGNPGASAQPCVFPRPIGERVVLDEHDPQAREEVATTLVADGLVPLGRASSSVWDGRWRTRRHRPLFGETVQVSEGRAAEIALNRELWAIVNERFTNGAAESMWRKPEVAWGLFAAPERELGVLGDVHGLDVLELACGTAYFAAWLARAGARPVALDFSGEQLATARHLQARLGPTFPLVHGDAEQVPLASGLFDLVVSEHGVAAWCDPERWLPEAARLLRPGGRLVFLTNSNLSTLCVPAEGGVTGDRLLRGQREAHRVQWPGGGIEFHPSPGEWVRQLRSAGFVIEAMHEIYAPEDGVDPPFYEIVSRDWASRWPGEELWVAVRP
jgi:SAM-dependent methyltransferase